MTVFHIPHSSTFIPVAYREKLWLNKQELTLELLRMTDWHTDDLFSDAFTETDTVIKFDYCRLMVDPERFEDETKETMTKVGMGVIYERTSDQRVLRSAPTIEERETLLSQFYRPHHASLEAAVSAELTSTGHSLIVDCHSFPSKALPYETDQQTNRPDICIGTDVFHTPSSISENLKSAFELLGYSVELNRPFFGTIVPMAYYRCHPKVHSLMLEISRSLYIDETTSNRLRPGYQVTKQHIGSVLKSRNQP